MPAGVYDLTLKLRNWANGEASVSSTITRGQAPGPKAAILGEAEQNSAVSDQLIIQGMASRSTCDGADAGPLRYSWSFYPQAKLAKHYSEMFLELMSFSYSLACRSLEHLD